MLPPSLPDTLPPYRAPSHTPLARRHLLAIISRTPCPSLRPHKHASVTLSPSLAPAGFPLTPEPACRTQQAQSQTPPAAPLPHSP